MFLTLPRRGYAVSLQGLLAALGRRPHVMRCQWMACAAMVLMVCAGSLRAEDGAALWLRYLPSQGAARA
ncbi:hypothetical protein, partial [Xanthomonas sacchari]|uniref:hypothetical protein n=1 Tax=Xanthomonas sacchari TaxID=56458 RepID=UPI002253E0D0